MIDERKNYLIHPSFIGLGLLLLGMTALFVGFSFAYVYTRVQSGLPPLRLPVLFIFNTLILIASSYVLLRSMTYYKADETAKYKRSLGVTLLLTIMFLISQLVAWNQLYNQGIFLTHSTMASYLYIISFVHFMHVIVGIPFLALFYYKALKKMVEPISVLIYFSDPVKRRQLKLLTVYWHFLDGLWIYLVLFFLINLIF